MFWDGWARQTVGKNDTRAASVKVSESNWASNKSSYYVWCQLRDKTLANNREHREGGWLRQTIKNSKSSDPHSTEKAKKKTQNYLSLHDSSNVSSWANYGGGGRDTSAFPWTLQGRGGHAQVSSQANKMGRVKIIFFWVFSAFMHEINCGKDILITPAACVNAVSVLPLNNVTLTLFSLLHLTLQCLFRRGFNPNLNMRS